MDFSKIEHPFVINNNMPNWGLTAFDGSSVVEINTRRFNMSDEFEDDIAEMTHRVFHEKRHVYQNIQRSLAIGDNPVEPLTLYSNDLADKFGRSSSDFYDFIKNNKYDYNVVLDGRFPLNRLEKDIDYAIGVSYNQANYISSVLEYWTQFIEKDAEKIGLTCGREVEKIIRTIKPDDTKISKYAQDNNIDFDEALSMISKKIIDN